MVDTGYESCCGLVTQFAAESGLRITPAAARPLYTGMVTDSGRFRFNSTTSRTFRLAAMLMDQPLDTDALYRHLYSTDLALVKLRAQYVGKIRLTANGVAYICTDRGELAVSGQDFFTISRGMVGVMSDIRGVDIWANFTETDKGVVCELRSSRFNINPVAVRYGGGGHERACGATVPDMETAMRLLNDLNEMAGAANEG